MTLLELFQTDILADYVDYVVYSETEEIYKGCKPFMEIDAKYSERKVLRITPLEKMTFYIFVSKD